MQTRALTFWISSLQRFWKLWSDMNRVSSFVLLLFNVEFMENNRTQPAAGLCIDMLVTLCVWIQQNQRNVQTAAAAAGVSPFTVRNVSGLKMVIQRVLWIHEDIWSMLVQSWWSLESGYPTTRTCENRLTFQTTNEVRNVFTRNSYFRTKF